MDYRRLPKGTEEISVIGFGGSGLHQAGEKAGAETVLAAIEHGVNYFDMAVSEAAAFKSYRAAFAGRREQRRWRAGAYTAPTAAPVLL